MVGALPDQGGRRRCDMTFVQLGEWRTSGRDEMHRLLGGWVTEGTGRRTPTHAVAVKHRADASHIVDGVECPSYEEAMRNSNLPETGKIFQDMVALCDEMPTFTDLDVVRDEQLGLDAVRRLFAALESEGEL